MFRFVTINTRLEIELKLFVGFQNIIKNTMMYYTYLLLKILFNIKFKTANVG